MKRPKVAMPLDDRDARIRIRIRNALLFSGYTSGLTHHFYHYPARFSPEFARTVVQELCRPNDWVVDPFMGGGTSIIEGLALNRSMLGVDINALAHFVTTVRTTPLSQGDEEQLLHWAQRVSRVFSSSDFDWGYEPNVRNLPRPVETVLAGALVFARELPFPRQQAFARCALLRLGQWALEARDLSVVRRRCLAQELPRVVRSMLAGLRQFVERCRIAGLSKDQITNHRLLLNRDTVGIHEEDRLKPFRNRVKLVLTSPPYPAVHVLYHRWQVRGRKETPAPYWIADVPDGCGASFYTFGSRTPTGLENYFRMLSAAFTSIRPFLTPNALVVQLVAFAEPETYLARYLAAMNDAGYVEARLFHRQPTRFRRRVPNRRWYATLKGETNAACELLLIHRRRD